MLKFFRVCYSRCEKNPTISMNELNFRKGKN
jgi:hypothetical protein